MSLFKRDENDFPMQEDTELGESPQAVDTEGGEAEESIAEQNVLKLKSPLKANGGTYKQLEYDFGELTARDLHKASKELKSKGIPVSVPALDFDYQLVIFSMAVKAKMKNIELFDLMRLSAADTMKATALARSFLLDSDPAQMELASGD